MKEEVKYLLKVLKAANQVEADCGTLYDYKRRLVEVVLDKLRLNLEKV